MSDRQLVLKKLAFIEGRVAELRRHVVPEEIESNVVQAGFAARMLQTAIQAVLDAASIIVSIERLGEPSTNREMFDLLVRNGWVPADMLATLHGMVGFRNILVHGYAAVDDRRVRACVENELGDLLAFAEHVRARLTGSNHGSG